ncbi:acyl-CoA-binding domain-containing protein 6-like isoform X2 [Argopecten irradians]|uniref:acyl-CoA-binding domain-containing protein 6-like isoform X2 n=1 Tax=Argopecten irradians TaxID=31199 RepID=UPI00371DFCE0
MADDVDDDLTELFEGACNYIRQSSGMFDSEKLLYFYSRYKQATEGRCNTNKPGIFDFQGKHKWEAWKKLGDMSKKAAMFQYITFLGNVDPEWQKKGMTLLHWACDRGLSEMVEVLIKLKADINAQDLEQQTPLHFAVCCEQEDVVRQLLQNGANLSLKDCDGLNPAELDTSIEIKNLFEKHNKS